MGQQPRKSTRREGLAINLRRSFYTITSTDLRYWFGGNACAREITILHVLSWPKKLSTKASILQIFHRAASLTGLKPR
jgi:hypothetical protein